MKRNVVFEVQQDRQLPESRIFMLFVKSEVKVLFSNLPEVSVRLFVP